eukprot:CCRYP_018740-RA/>CCRYP_018740-RA protein AED:0.46 eAED:0.64 QI:0/-1/0/1/-1/0/1/0/36
MGIAPEPTLGYHLLRSPRTTPHPHMAHPPHLLQEVH